MKTLKKLGLIVLLLVLCAHVAESQEDIYDAVANGDLLLVKEILQEQPELLNEKNEEAFTPLNLACFRGQAGITGFLLESGADPYIGDNENSMPIHLSAISGSFECLDLLLEYGVDIDITDENDMTPLLFALSRRQIDMANYLIEKGADVKLRSVIGWSPLHFSIVLRNDDLTKLILEQGAEVNVSLESGATPLHSAVSFGNTEMVSLLLKHGAKIDAENNQGDRPLNWAVNPNTLDALKILIENGADIKHSNEHGATLLHNVAGRGTAFETVDFLLAKGIDIDVQDDWGRTPLFLTAWSQNPDGMSKYLILKGANVNPSNCMDEKTCACFPNFSTPLHAAARHGQLDMTKNLVSSGAKLNIYNHEGLTPLHCAIQSGDPEIVEYLIEKGAFMDVAEENTGSTELHLAVAMGYTDIMEILIENGADPNIPDDNNKTPFDYAMYYGHNDLGYELLGNGADDSGLATYLNEPDELYADLSQGEARVWFLGHSGWAVKTQNHFLIFDYFCNTWDRKADDSCLASGCIIPEEIKDMNVTVFSTHAHGDHYDPRMFNWNESITDIEYVLCWNQPVEDHEYTLIPVHEEAMVEDMNVYVHYSTDLGGGYLVEVDGLTILHMGDHANGEDDLMAAYTDEIDMIRDKGVDIDILFSGIRGCSLGEPEQVKQGVYYTLEQLQPKLFVPMHGGSHSFAYKEFVETARADGFDLEMVYPVHKGDRFTYAREEMEGITQK